MRSTELFPDTIDRIFFLTELAGAASRRGWKVMMVCLMTTHYHLLVETPDESLPVGMHDLNFRYAVRFNSRHRLRGHVLERRYYSGRIKTASQLLAAYRYIARNPVQARLCESPDQWAWSSHAALVSPTESFTFVDASPVIGCFGGTPEQALEHLRAFVNSAW